MLKKKAVITINNCCITEKKLKIYIGNYRRLINNQNFSKIYLLPNKSLEFISCFYAIMLEGITVQIIDELNNFKPNKDEIVIGPEKLMGIVEGYITYDLITDDSIIDKSNFVINIEKTDLEAININGNILTFGEIQNFLLMHKSKNIFGKNDKILGNLELNSLYALCFQILLPINLKIPFVFSGNLKEDFKLEKPTIFIGNDIAIKNLYKIIIKELQKNPIREKVFEIIKYIEKDNFTVFLNRTLLGKKYNSLKIVVSESSKDFKGLWLEFETLGVEFYAGNHIENKIE